MGGRSQGEEKISGKELRFQLRAGESLLSLQVSHNMYQIQSVSDGHFFPRPQTRPVFAELRVLALPPVSGEPSHLRAVSSPSPRGLRSSRSLMESPQCPWPEEQEHGFRSPKKTRCLCPVRNALISANKAVNPVRKLVK